MSWIMVCQVSKLETRCAMPVGCRVQVACLDALSLTRFNFSRRQATLQHS